MPELDISAGWIDGQRPCRDAGLDAQKNEQIVNGITSRAEAFFGRGKVGNIDIATVGTGGVAIGAGFPRSIRGGGLRPDRSDEIPRVGSPIKLSDRQSGIARWKIGGRDRHTDKTLSIFRNLV